VYIQVGEPLVQEPYHVPADRLFVPPKSITDNLNTKRTPKISKIVFTSQENDDNPGFTRSTKVSI